MITFTDDLAIPDFELTSDTSQNPLTVFASRPDIQAILAEMFRGEQGPQGPQGPAASDIELVAGEDIPAAGLPLSISPLTGKVVLARADTYTKSLVFGLSDTPALTDFPVSVKRGRLSLPDWTAVTGTPDLLPGHVYFLGLSGGLTTIAPNAVGQSLSAVGVAVDARVFMPSQHPPILL